MIAGGIQMPYAAKNYISFEVIFGNSRSSKLPNLWREDPLMQVSCELLLHNGQIFMIDGKNCLLFDHGTWKQHSVIPTSQRFAAVSTDIGIFLFEDGDSYEYLPNGQTTWKIGNNKIPGGFEKGSAIFVESNDEITYKTLLFSVFIRLYVHV